LFSDERKIKYFFLFFSKIFTKGICEPFRFYLHAVCTEFELQSPLYGALGIIKLSFQPNRIHDGRVVYFEDDAVSHLVVS
jgi:hypothetical protein